MVTTPAGKTSIWTKATAALTGAASQVAQAVTLSDDQRVARLETDRVTAAVRADDALRTLTAALAAEADGGPSADEAQAAHDAATNMLRKIERILIGVRQRMADQVAAQKSAANEARDAALAETIDDTLSVALECDKLADALRARLLELGQSVEAIAGLSGHLHNTRTMLAIAVQAVPAVLARKCRMGGRDSMPLVKPNLIDHFAGVGESIPGYRGAVLMKEVA